MMAGSYYMLISKISGDANAVAGMFPTATPGTLISTTLNGGVQNTLATELGRSYWFQSNADRDAQKILAGIGASYNASVSAWNEAAANAGLREFITERAYAGDDASSPENFLPPPTNLLKGIQLLAPDTITVDPMIGLMAYASTFLTYAVVAIGVLATASAVPLFGSIPATLAAMTSGLFQIGIFAAIFVGFVLPYLPAVIWLIAILAFMLLVIEAVFAAPLWAVAMLSMDGHGISSNISRKGWSLLLMLFLTPLLMVFGFLLGMVLFRIAAFSLNGMLFAALSSQMAADPGAFGVLSQFLTMAVLTVFVGLLYVVIIDWSFSLINVFPARVFKWIDGIGDDLGAGTAMTARAAGVADPTKEGPQRAGWLAPPGNIGLANNRSRQPRQIGNKACKRQITIERNSVIAAKMAIPPCWFVGHRQDPVPRSVYRQMQNDDDRCQLQEVNRLRDQMDRDRDQAFNKSKMFGTAVLPGTRKCFDGIQQMKHGAPEIDHHTDSQPLATKMHPVADLAMRLSYFFEPFEHILL